MLGNHWENILKFIGVIIQLVGLSIALCTYIHVKNKENQELLYSQANQISVWLLEDAGRDEDNVVIDNSSNNPVYDVVLSPGNLNKGVPYLKGSDVTISLPPIPPGRWSTKLPIESVIGMHSEPWVAVAFKDIRGQSWVREATGDLETINVGSRDFMGVSLPVTYASVKQYRE